jgi:hypothetical protein
MPTAEPRILAHIRRLAAPGFESLTDAELAAHFAITRAPEAFELLVRRHGPMVWAACRRILRDSHDTDDAFQTTFLVLARNAGRLRSNVGGWLHRVAVNAALKVKARRAASPLVGEVPARPERGSGEFAAAVDDELNRLPARFRTAFILKCNELAFSPDGKTLAVGSREFGTQLWDISGVRPAKK